MDPMDWLVHEWPQRKLHTLNPFRTPRTQDLFQMMKDAWEVSFICKYLLPDLLLPEDSQQLRDEQLYEILARLRALRLVYDNSIARAYAYEFYAHLGQCVHQIENTLGVSPGTGRLVSQPRLLELLDQAVQQGQSGGLAEQFRSQILRSEPDQATA